MCQHTDCGGSVPTTPSTSLRDRLWYHYEGSVTVACRWEEKEVVEGSRTNGLALPCTTTRHALATALGPGPASSALVVSVWQRAQDGAPDALKTRVNACCVQSRYVIDFIL